MLGSSCILIIHLQRSFLHVIYMFIDLDLTPFSVTSQSDILLATSRQKNRVDKSKLTLSLLLNNVRPHVILPILVKLNLSCSTYLTQVGWIIRSHNKHKDSIFILSMLCLLRSAFSFGLRLCSLSACSWCLDGAGPLLDGHRSQLSFSEDLSWSQIATIFSSYVVVLQRSKKDTDDDDDTHQKTEQRNHNFQVPSHHAIKQSHSAIEKTNRNTEAGPFSIEDI